MEKDGMSDPTWRILAGLGPALTGAAPAPQPTLTVETDWLKQFGQTPRWGTTPAITEREVTQLKRIAEGCQPWDAQGEMKKLTARVIKLEMLVNELINQQLRGY